MIESKHLICFEIFEIDSAFRKIKSLT